MVDSCDSAAEDTGRRDGMEGNTACCITGEIKNDCDMGKPVAKEGSVTALDCSRDAKSQRGGGEAERDWGFEGEGEGVLVVAVEHAKGRGAVGMYFHFLLEEAEAQLGVTIADGSILEALHCRTRERGAVKLWRSNRGGSSGDAHGRWHPERRRVPLPNRWRKGDRFMLAPMDSSGELSLTDCLSDETLREVLASVGPTAAMAAAQVCSSWRVLLSSDHLWERICLAEEEARIGLGLGVGLNLWALPESKSGERPPGSPSTLESRVRSAGGADTQRGGKSVDEGARSAMKSVPSAFGDGRWRERARHLCECDEAVASFWRKGTCVQVPKSALGHGLPHNGSDSCFPASLQDTIRLHKDWVMAMYLHQGKLLSASADHTIAITPVADLRAEGDAAALKGGVCNGFVPSGSRILTAHHDEVSLH